MVDNRTKHPKKPPEISPYLFPFLLAAFGLWCFYDGWITKDLEMLEHMWFNRIASFILLPWAAYDFLKVRKYEKLAARKTTAPEINPDPNDEP